MAVVNIPVSTLMVASIASATQALNLELQECHVLVRDR